MMSGLPLGPVGIPGRIICCCGLAGACGAGRPEVLGSCPDADAITMCLTRLRGADIGACARSDSCMLDGSTAVEQSEGAGPQSHRDPPCYEWILNCNALCLVPGRVQQAVIVK